MDIPTNLIPLIDSGGFLYGACAAVESHTDNPQLQDAIDVLENRLREVAVGIKSDAEPVFCFGTKTNFRFAISTSRPYKPNRSEKPFLYPALEAYVRVTYNYAERQCVEDDDTMAMLSDGKTNIIVSADKDLTQVNGYYYRPELWNSGSYGPVLVSDSTSFIQPKNPSNIGKGLTGIGYKFFWAQVIMGDSVDGISGLPKHGPKFAYDLLKDVKSEWEAYEAVKWAYRDIYYNSDACMREQVDLLYMVRELDGGGLPIMYVYPEENVNGEEDS